MTPEAELGIFGISIAAGLLEGLNREAAARFSFLMATPVVAGAGAWEALKLLKGEAGVHPQASLIVIGFVAAATSGILANSRARGAGKAPMASGAPTNRPSPHFRNRSATSETPTASFGKLWIRATRCACHLAPE